MKKIILIILIGLTLTLTGCMQDYKDYREQFMIDCQADTECVEFMIQDADDIIKQTPAYIALDADLTIATDNITQLETDLLDAQNELVEHENRINSLEELTEQEYMQYFTDKYLALMNNADVCGIPIATELVKDQDGNFTANITILDKTDLCVYDNSALLIIANGLIVDLPNYTIENLEFIN